MFTNMARTVFLYLLLITVMRILGKKQVGQLDPTEFVVILLLSELVSLSMQDMNIPLIHCIIPTLTLLCIEIIFSVLEMKSKKLRDLMQGNPVLVISEGKLLYDALKATRYNIDDIMQQLRLSGYPDIRSVGYAIIENSGELSIIPKSSERPPTANELELSLPPDGFSYTVISDGKINDTAMRKCGLTETALFKKLKEHRISDIGKIMFATYDTCGNFYFQPFERKKK